MGEDIEGKGFVIRDRRSSTMSEEELKAQERGERRKEAGKGEPPPERKGRRGEETLPEADFSSLILFLSTQAMYTLGDIPDPTSQEREKNLPVAKHYIDLIGILKEKTRGNLDPHEERLVEDVLYELRMRYVKEAKGKGK